MESKSHDSDQLVNTIINSFEALSKRLEKQEEALKKNTEACQALISSQKQLEVTINSTNKIFDQVATGVKDLYEKVKQLEILGKLMGNFANLGPLFGGGGTKAKP
jgi:uncharacterized phage infection (PIP) family protein YhgE